MHQIKKQRWLGFGHWGAAQIAIAALDRRRLLENLARARPGRPCVYALLAGAFTNRARRAEQRKGLIGNRLGLFVGALIFVILASQFLSAPAWAQQAQIPPGMDNSYYDKEKDPSDKTGKKERPTKTVRAAKCQECQEARDALQKAVENWYQFQVDEQQSIINAENKKAKPNANVIAKANKIKADAQQGAKQNSNAPKTKKELTDEIAKLKKALDDCEKDECGKPHAPGYTELPVKLDTKNKIKQVVDWISNYQLPTCSDDKEKTKKDVQLMLKDAKAAAARIPDSDQEAKKDIENYIKRLETFKVDELPPCTETHTGGFTELPHVVTSDEDLKKIVDWINGMVAKLPDCSDDKEKTKKEVEQMLKDVDEAIGWITQASHVGKFAKAADEALKTTLETKKKIQDFLDNKLKNLPSCKDGGIRKSSKFIFPGFGYYSRPGGESYTVTFTGDSTQVCTFDDGPGVSAPIAFADDRGNATVIYFDPQTGESADFSPDETPPPGWKKVIPTSDPKPRPGIANLGIQPELWVNPETGETKWVELGSDYKPIDPPEGWVELVPRGEQSKPKSAEEQPSRRASAPPPTGTPETPKAPDTPAQTPEPPRSQTAETPPSEQQTSTETPKSPTTPGTPVTMTDAPPQIPDTVFVKAKESVLQGEPPGKPLQGQTVKLLPPDKPDLPGRPETKTARDTGFDKPPAQCTTGTDGDCKINVPPEERETYNLPSRPNRPRQNYRVDVDVRQTTGGIVETTGERTVPDLGSARPGIYVDTNNFKIGNRTFARIQSRSDAGTNVSLRESFEKPGQKYEDDTCREKQPGPPLGMQPDSWSALNRDLPEASVSIRSLIRRIAR